MKDCLHCSKPLVHVPGRKEKSFCDVNCRNKYFYAQRKKQIETAKSMLADLPSDYIMPKKIGVLTKDGEVKPLTLPKPNKKPKIQPPAVSDEVVSPAGPEACDRPEIDEEAIRAQIKAINAEKCPEHRNTSIGKKSWEMEQKKRIEALKQQLMPC